MPSNDEKSPSDGTTAEATQTDMPTPPVAASDPRSLTIDRGGQEPPSPEAAEDAEIAAEQGGG